MTTRGLSLAAFGHDVAGVRPPGNDAGVLWGRERCQRAHLDDRVDSRHRKDQNAGV